jgi:hypothetical protein
VLRHVNNGYCSLLEPKQISGSQFAEWITGRNPGTYVAVHYIKLIDFSFADRGANEPSAMRLVRIGATGQRGLVGPSSGPTWDSVQLQMIYAYPDGREAAFDIHTSWVTPDNFPGYVEQEVQFRFDNGVWNAHQRKRGVEVTVEGRTPGELKITPNHHYNGTFVEPWGSAATASRSCAGSSRRSPSSSSRAPLPCGANAWSGCAVCLTTTRRPTATPWRWCRPWRRFCRRTPRGGRVAWWRSTAPPAAWSCTPPGEPSRMCSTPAGCDDGRQAAGEGQ